MCGKVGRMPNILSVMFESCQWHCFGVYGMSWFQLFEDNFGGIQSCYRLKKDKNRTLVKLINKSKRTDCI